MIDRVVSDSPPAQSTAHADLLAALTAIVGHDRIDTAPEQLRLLSQDVYRAGEAPLAALVPSSTDEVAQIVRTARRHAVPLFIRGGGMSYTDAYLPNTPHALLLDMRRLNRVREINERDLYVTVEAGCTWAELDRALAPHALRAMFWGPMSGSLATIGGGMSQGAATFGSVWHGTSAAAALAFEVVLGDGQILRTGLADEPHRAPFFRHYGPDLTGLFTGDAGALGIKTAVTLQLEPRPAQRAALSFAFGDFAALQAAVSEIARLKLATEIFGVETALARLIAGETHAADGMRALLAVGRSQWSVGAAIAQVSRMAIAGRRFLSAATFTANFLCEAHDAAQLTATVASLRSIASRLGEEVPNTMAAVVQATPFPTPMLLGPGGRRLLPLNVILPPSRVVAFHDAFAQLRKREADNLRAAKALLFAVFAVVGPAGILHEPVIYWEDEPTQLQRAHTPPELLAQMPRYPANPAGRNYVERLRVQLVELMAAHGGAHLQIGRAYPYLRGRSPEFPAFLRQLKAATDPDNLLNPGALGLPDRQA